MKEQGWLYEIKFGRKIVADQEFNIYKTKEEAEAAAKEKIENELCDDYDTTPDKFKVKVHYGEMMLF